MEIFEIFYTGSKRKIMGICGILKSNKYFFWGEPLTFYRSQATKRKKPARADFSFHTAMNLELQYGVDHAT